MKVIWIAPILAVTLAGCGSVGAIGVPLGAQQAVAPPQTLTPAPSNEVVVTPLPPVDDSFDTGPTAEGFTPPADPLATPGQTDTQAAALPPDGSQEIGRTDLLGGWTISSGSETCELFMTLTAWTGGYRASTRGCTSEVLAAISAWNLVGTQVVLASADGTPLANLAATSSTRFNGTVQGTGATITFFR